MPSTNISTPDASMRPMSLWQAVGYTFAITLLFLFLSILPVGILATPSTTAYIVTFACQGIAYLGGIALIANNHAKGVPFRQFLGLTKTPLLFYPLSILLGLASMWPSAALYEAINRRFPVKDSFEETLLELVNASSWYQQFVLGFLVIVFGPALEEALFRGALALPLVHRYGKSGSILITSVLFSLVHIVPQKLLPIALWGLALGFLRLSSRSLWPPILLHATYNAVSFFAMLYHDKPKDLDPPSIPIELNLATSAISILLLYLVHRLGRASSAPPMPPAPEDST